MFAFSMKAGPTNLPRPLSRKPARVQARKQVVAEAGAVVQFLLKNPSCLTILEQYGAVDYWREFTNHFLFDRDYLGDGVVYFKIVMQKLLIAATEKETLSHRAVEGLVVERDVRDSYIRRQPHYRRATWRHILLRSKKNSLLRFISRLNG